MVTRTSTGPTGAALGTTVLIWVSETTVTGAGAPPKVIAVVPLSPVPLMVTGVPGAPEGGVIVSIVGGAGVVGVGSGGGGTGMVGGGGGGGGVVVTVTVSTAELFASIGSGVVVRADALFVTVWPTAASVARAVIVSVLVPPAASDPTLQSKCRRLGCSQVRRRRRTARSGACR